MIWVYEETKSNFYLSLHACTIFGSSALGSVMYTLKFFKKDLLVLMIVSKLLMGIFLAFLAFYLSLALLYLFLASFYITSSIFIPSAQALLPSLISSEDIQRWNGNYFTSYNLSLCLGWLCGPLIFPVLNYKGLFLLDSFLSLICIIILLFIYLACHRDKLATLNSDLSYPNNITSHQKKSFRKINIKFVLRSFGLISLVFAVIDSLEMGIFSQIYKIGEHEIACFFIAWVMGGIVASYIAKKVDPHIFLNLFIYSNYLFPIFTCALIIHTTIIFSIFIYGACGLLYGMSQLLSNFLIYVCCHPSDYASVFNKKRFTSSVYFLISSPIIGFTADLFSITSSLLVTCIVSFLALFAHKYLSSRQVRLSKK